MTVTFVPLSTGVWGTVVQLVVVRFAFCCKTNPVEGEGHEMSTLLVGVREIESNGAPGV